MERLAEIIAILSDEAQVLALSDDDLTALRTELAEIGLAITAGDVETDDPVAAAASAADNYEGVQYVIDSRAEAAAAQAEALAAQAARFTAETPTEPEGDEGDGEGGEGDEPEAPAEPTVAEAAPVAPAPEAAPAAPVLEPVGAAVTPPAAPAPAPALPALGTVAPPARSAPAPARAESRLMRMATQEYGTLDEMIEDTLQKHDSFLGMAGGASEKVPIGRVKWDIPDDRNLAGVDDQTQYQRLSMLLDGASRSENWGEALVAAGGFCAPGEPDYSIPVVSGTQRPVRDALPTVGMARGSTIVATPPTLASVVSSTTNTAGSAVSVMTNANDIASATKPVQVVPCATTQTITLQAIVERLQFGNSMSRAWPELVRAWYELTASAWARRAESELLRQIDGFSTANTTTQILGATADFKGYLHQAAAAQRNRNRMPKDARLRALVPAWLIDLIGADLAHMHAGDGLNRFTDDVESFVRGLFNSANVTPTFYEDTAATGATTNQLFGALVGGVDLQNFPPGPGVTSARMIWYLFPEGTFARGDGGTLDLGIVRDSTLNNTNDFQFFSESWEAVVPHIIEALKITSTICATGQGAIDVTTTAYCTAS